MLRTNFRTKANAKRHRGAGRRVYHTKAGWRVSPECPRRGAKRRALIRQRTADRQMRRARPAGKTMRSGSRLVRLGLGIIDVPF
jgi:hypothetical protein